MPQRWTIFAPSLEMLLAGMSEIHILKNLRSTSWFTIFHINLESVKVAPALRVCVIEIGRLISVVQTCLWSHDFREPIPLGCMQSPRCSGCKSVCSL